MNVREVRRKAKSGGTADFVIRPESDIFRLGFIFYKGMMFKCSMLLSDGGFIVDFSLKYDIILSVDNGGNNYEF